MKRKRIWILALLALAAAAAVWWLLPGSDGGENSIPLTGNIELREVRIAFKIPGKLDEITVQEGDPVQPGMLLASLGRDQLLHQRQQARAQVDSAESRLKELQFNLGFQRESLREQTVLRGAEVRQAQAALDELLAGSRSQEIAQARAGVESAEAVFEKSQADLQRARALFETDDISRSQLEEFETAADRAQAALTQAQQHLALVLEGPRSERIEAARARLEQAQAALRMTEARRLEIRGLEQSAQTLRSEIERFRALAAQIDSQLADSQQHSPIEGVVLVRVAEPGEVVAAGTPVLTLGDMAHPWLRGYISERDLGRVRIGSRVEVRTDSYPGKVYPGTVSFIASEAEFTPKQIYTPEQRTRLVYRIKVDLENPNQELKLNMPVEGVLRLEESGS